MTKKVNERKDYSYSAKKGPPKYKPAKIPRKPNFLILRGPGLDPRQVIEENNELRAFAEKKQVKIKFLQAHTEDEMVKMLKESNTWATGVVLNRATLTDETGKIKKTNTQILCATEELGSDGSYLTALKKLIASA